MSINKSTIFFKVEVLSVMRALYMISFNISNSEKLYYYCVKENFFIMKYDFTTLLNRKGHDALALDVLPIKDVEVDPNFSTIPMWVADMNYPVFENIQKQMIERINEPHFGYFEIPEDYYKRNTWHRCGKRGYRI